MVATDRRHYEADACNAEPEGAARADARREGPSAGTALVVLAVVGGIVPLALAWHFGALGIPRNDDWAYARSAFAFADTGRVSGSGWAGMNLVGQLVLAYPVVAVFGHRIAALQFEVAALGVLGLYATFDLATQVVSRRRALFVAVLVATLPMWSSTSASFMTDVPAFALATVSLALGVRALERPELRPGLFFASLAAGFFAFTIRENAIVAPLAVCAGAAVAVPERPWRVGRATIVRAAAGLLVVAGAFFVWRRSLPGFIHEKSHVPTVALGGQAAVVTLQGARLLALLLIPVVVLADPRALVRRARARAPRATRVVVWLVGALAVASVLLRATHAGLLGPGDYVLPNGNLGTGARTGLRPDLLPRWLLLLLAAGAAWVLVIVVATAAGWVASRGRRRYLPPASPASFVVAVAATGYVVSYVLAVALGYSRFFDRYLIPVVPLVAMLLLRNRASALTSRRVRIAGCAALAAAAAVGVVYAANSAAYDGAKWRVAGQAAAFTGDATRVDGGRVWNDSAAGRHLRGRFRGACVVLHTGPETDADVSGVVAAQPVWGPLGTQTWVVARRVPGASCQRST